MDEQRIAPSTRGGLAVVRPPTVESRLVRPEIPDYADWPRGRISLAALTHDPVLRRVFGSRLAARGLKLAEREIESTEQLYNALQRRGRWRHESDAAREEEIQRLLPLALSASELGGLNRDLQDRFGQPRRTVQDLQIEGGITPLRLIIHDSDEEAHDAAAVAADGAGDLLQ